MTKILFITLFLFVSNIFARELIPERAQHPAPFERPREGALDDEWVYARTIYDADSSRPDLFGAYPVALEFTHQGRGFLAVLHTVFRSLNAGMTWQNLDPQPPPNFSFDFIDLRSPGFISDLAVRPTENPAIQQDIVFLSVIDADGESGSLRAIGYGGGNHFLYPDSFFFTGRWLTNVAAPDTQHTIAIAGLDGKIYRTVSMGIWDTLGYDFSDSWISDVITVGDTVLAAGAAHWKSHDAGETWEIFPAADSLFDNSVHFAPNRLNGVACGGGEDENPRGWIRYTTDGGVTWSERVLETLHPLRAVRMVTDSLGFAVGGDYLLGTGQIYRTNDVGQTWALDLQTDADMRVVSVARLSAAYVHVVAAGVYPDFSGGVWYQRFFIPDTSGAVLIAIPDTLEFGTIEAGLRDTMSVTMQNIGSDAAFVITMTSTNPVFQPLCCMSSIVINPQDSLVFDIVFRPDSAGDYSGAISVLNGDNDFIQVQCHGSAGISDADAAPVLPSNPRLSVYPNPGNAEFSIAFELTQSANVSLSIYDITGRKAAALIDERRAAGEHRVMWNASDAASGIYFVRLDAGQESVMKKMVVVK